MNTNLSDSTVGAVQATAHIVRTDADTAPVVPRLCTECGESIPTKRLAAQPNAQQCAPCLERMGDVPRIKRYDEVGVDGSMVSTTFTRNPALERHMTRMNSMSAPNKCYNEAVGDDSHLTKPETSVRSSDSMASAFEEEPERVEVKKPIKNDNPEDFPEVDAEIFILETVKPVNDYLM